MTTEPANRSKADFTETTAARVKQRKMVGVTGFESSDHCSPAYSCVYQAALHPEPRERYRYPPKSKNVIFLN